MDERRNGFWMVWCEGGGTPTVRHQSYQSADAEASRLARLNRGQVFYVLRCVGGRVMPAPQPSEIEVIYQAGESAGEREWN
jgi:hypothetical protein